MPQPTEEQRKQWEEKIKNMSPEELQELQRQQCIFCQIVTGKIPSKKVYEDAVCIAILDINPAAKGHLLLLPKEHYAIMPQLPEKVLGHLTIVSKNLSQVLLKVLRADGTTLFIANGAAAGQRAQHFLLHLIPRKSNDGVLLAEEHLVGAEMALKVKMAVEKKLLALLGGKKELKKNEAEDAEKKATETKAVPKLEKEKEKEMFITSATAKRYHREKCPFAQNIPPEKKVTFSLEEAEQSGRKPCTCVSGKKIPLVNPDQEQKKGTKNKEPRRSKESQKVISSVAPKQSIVSKSKNQKHQKNPLHSQHPRNSQKNEVSLDDIANLFK